MASPLKTPGLKFFADPVIRDPEGGPRTNELYVVCHDGSIQSVYHPDQYIDWDLIEDGPNWYYGPDRKKCIVRFHSRAADPPIGRVPDAPQKAEITEQRDVDLEVISRNLDPLLAQCAVIVNDPDQTDALARFAEGKMSYAEMRARCG